MVTPHIKGKKLEPFSICDKMNDVWKAGYCQKTVEQIRKTYNDPNGPNSLKASEYRIKQLKKHLGPRPKSKSRAAKAIGCKDCYHAMIMKDAEATVAKRMGIEAWTAFALGYDITKMAGFSGPFQDVMRELELVGRLSEAFIKWRDKVASRQDYFKETGAKKPDAK